MSEALTIAGMKPKDFGRNLIIAAEEQERADLIKKAVNVVRDFKNQLEHREHSIREFTALKARLLEKLDSIERGHFKMDRYSQIVFNDSDPSQKQ